MGKMKIKQNVFALALALVLTIGLTACSTSDASVSGAATSVAPSVSQPAASSAPASEPDSASASEPASAPASEAPSGSEAASSSAGESAAEGSVLVAYYSHSGNTEAVAQQIAQLTGGTLAQIQRAEEYTDLYQEGETEILEGVRPEITVSVDNVEDYDTVFVGYPIWWDEAPAMIATFLERYDFSGKTIIPYTGVRRQRFCRHHRHHPGAAAGRSGGGRGADHLPQQHGGSRRRRDRMGGRFEFGVNRP